MRVKIPKHIWKYAIGEKIESGLKTKDVLSDLLTKSLDFLDSKPDKKLYLDTPTGTQIDLIFPKETVNRLRLARKRFPKEKRGAYPRLWAVCVAVIDNYLNETK